MPPEAVRRATEADLSTLVELCLLAATQRQTIDPQLWPIAADAPTRITDAIRRDLAQPERVAWLLAEGPGGGLGAAQVMALPAPPVDDLGGGLAGLITDDFVVRNKAPPETWAALLSAAETFTRDHGAVVQVAACLTDWADKRAALEVNGYAPVTLWMAKTGLSALDEGTTGVRSATEADLPAIVELNVEAQERKCDAHPRFWAPHPEAPARFSDWMRHSLTLPDRDLLVAEGEGGVAGFIVAQPTGFPPAHDAAPVGLIDDFHSREFGAALNGVGPTPLADQLLRAAEQQLFRRGQPQVVAICPAAWTSKRDLLTRHGYQTAYLWMIRN